MKQSPPKNSLNPNIENEIIIGFHFIRKSANALAGDLRHFNEIPKYFTAEQVVNILGQIEEVEENIRIFREIFSRRVLG
jgi:hypothetical protein